MERAMLGATRETLFMRTLVGFRELIVELSMASTTVVSAVVSVVVVCESARGRHHESQRSRGDQSFPDGHGLSPVELPGRIAFRDHRTSVNLNPIGTPR